MWPLQTQHKFKKVKRHAALLLSASERGKWGYVLREGSAFLSTPADSTITCQSNRKLFTRSYLPELKPESRPLFWHAGLVLYVFCLRLIFISPASGCWISFFLLIFAKKTFHTLQLFWHLHGQISQAKLCSKQKMLHLLALTLILQPRFMPFVSEQITKRQKLINSTVMLKREYALCHV